MEYNQKKKKTSNKNLEMENDKENLINDDQKIFQDKKNGGRPGKINWIFFVLPP